MLPSSTFSGPTLSGIIKTIAFFIVPLCLDAQQISSRPDYALILNYIRGTDHKGHDQSWDVTQDRHGLLYVANGNGILEFDGVSWRLIELPDRNVVRTIYVDKENTKWIGGGRELGYLEPDSLGILTYHSLKEKIPSSHPLEGDVWNIFATPCGLLFRGGATLYLWRDGEFEAMTPSEGTIRIGYQAGERVFFLTLDRDASGSATEHLYQWTCDGLRLVPEAISLKGLKIYTALSHGNHTLFGTRNGGLFIYDGSSVRKFENEVDDYLIEKQLYKGMVLPDSSYAFATLRGGVILMDKQGKGLGTITREDGLMDNQVYGMGVDDHHGLWLASDNGISRTQPISPFRIYGDRDGLEGRVNQIVRHNGKLYVGTFQGLYVLEHEDIPYLSKFRRIEGIDSRCMALLSMDDHLLIASGDGLHGLSDDGVIRINQLANPFALHRSMRDPNRVFIGHEQGLTSVYLDGGTWVDEGILDLDVRGPIVSIAEDREGSLWLGIASGSVIEVNLDVSLNKDSADGPTDLRIERFDHRHGLPKKRPQIFTMNGELFVRFRNSRKAPYYRFDIEQQRFLEEERFGEHFGLDSLNVYPLNHQKGKDCFTLVDKPQGGRPYRFSACKEQVRRYRIDRIYDELVATALNEIAFWDDDNIVWYGGEILVRYDLNKNSVMGTGSKTLIRRVTTTQDSLVFGGVLGAYRTPVLPYGSNDLQFSFATPHFVAPNTNQYQYLLKGFEDIWSNWAKDAKKEYTNLPEGDYTFMVRSRDLYGNIGDTAFFDFRILPPWYRTWWSYLLFAMGTVALVLGIVFIWSGKLRRDKIRLQAVIDENVAEIRSQAEQLRELDKAKSRFLTNISHEFRTPLTLILGPLEQILKNKEWGDIHKVSVMHRNAKRVQRLIDQLLDLSRIESRSLKLRLVKGDVIAFLSPLVSSFSSYAEHRQISYETLISPSNHEGCFDPDKLEKMTYNLISNAFKFTSEGGTVKIVVKAGSEGLELRVSDTGTGISEEEIPYIFERFHRAEEARKDQREGIGVGLALTKELVVLHQGSIRVASTPGEGSTFTISLPLVEEAYQGMDFVDDASLPYTSSPITEYNTAYPAKEATKGERPLLLFVEDNRELREYLSGALGHHYKVLQASHGQEGIESAIHHIPDVIVSDWMMPKKDGLALCKVLKQDERTNHIPIILLTAKADVESKLEGLGIGADDYLTKPFNLEELQLRMRNLHQQRKLLKEKYSQMVTLKPQDIVITSQEEKFLQKAMAIVEHYMEDPSFSVEVFQRKVNMSRMQLHRKLKALTGYSTTEFIRSQRLKRAVSLLSEGSGNVSEVCYQVGFNSLSYFDRCFHKQYGMSPSKYLEQATHSDEKGLQPVGRRKTK